MWLDHLSKWRPIRDQISTVIQTLFFHSTCRYHLHTCGQEFYYECDWNCARIIVIVQHSTNKKMICLENNNNNNYEDFASFATLKKISSYLEDVVSHKNTRYKKVCVYYTYLCNISRDFSSSLAIEMYGRPCFSLAIPTWRVLPYSLIIDEPNNLQFETFFVMSN